MTNKQRFILLFFLALAHVIAAQNKPAPGPPTVAPEGIVDADSVQVTIILKHQQDKNLTEIRRRLEAQGFWDVFPPQEARVVSWTLAMGLGHVIVLQIPTGSVRRLNLAVEHGAWGAFDTEFYLSYDYEDIWREYISRRNDARDDRGY